MQHDFWHQKWEKNEIGFHVGEANPLLVDAFHQLSLPKGSRVFLPLCGKTLDIGWLLSQGYKVVGIELNESAIRQLFDGLGVEPEISSVGDLTHFSAVDIDIYVGDFFKLTSDLLGSVEAIYDRAALVALPEDMRQRYTQHLMKITGKASQLLITYAYDQSQLDGPPFSITKDEVGQHYNDSYAVKLLTTVDVPGGFKGICPSVENVWLLDSH